MAAKNITKADFLSKVDNYEADPKNWKFEGDKPAIIDFYANWCIHCKHLAPVYDELSDEYAGKVDFYKVDTDQEQDLSAAFGIRSIPALLFVPADGQPTMIPGALSKTDFKDAINDILLK